MHLRESWPRKVYLWDTSLSLRSRFSEEYGKLIENTVFLELLRRGNVASLQEVYYGSNKVLLTGKYLYDSFPVGRTMNTSEVKEYLIDFQEKALPELVERELKVDETGRITSIIGPRRAGKTYFMYQQMKEYLEKGIKKKNMLYLNFEDPRLIDVSFKEIRDIIKLHWQLYPESTKEKLIIFVDEPQNIKNWEIAVRALHDEGFKIFLTGSSSKLLSREIGTSLRGRTLSYLLLPFSFREYLKMKNAKFEIERLSSRSRALLLSHLDKYLEFGGFPEIVQEENDETKIRMINEYFNLVVYRDIVERYKIKNTGLIRWLIRALITSFSNEFSVHKYYLTLKSQGMSVSKNTIYAYFSMLQDALFIFALQKFDYSVRKRELTMSKVYLCDTAFTKIANTGRDIGKKMENAVFLELLRRNPLSEVFYWKNKRGEEVDFVVSRGLKVEELIQVSYDIEDPDTRKRELKVLEKAAEELGCKNKTVITWDYEEDGEVRFVPLWKWLLQN